MTTAFLFPGQGSQAPGMAAAFHDAWPETRDAFAGLDDALGGDADLGTLCFDADADRLRATEDTQPAVFAAGVTTHAGVVARYDPDPALLAGHSLGQFTALAAGGGLDPAAGVELVRRRGELMAAAARERGPGEMTAVLLADPETVAAACEERCGASVAAFNAPRQTVVSGTAPAVTAVREAVERAVDRARFVDLDVGAAFHSPVMEPAREPFADALADAPLSEPDVPVVSDVTGTVYTDPAVARRDLRDQLLAPVDWVGAVETLRERGVERFVEFPPAGTLADLVERIAPGAETVALETPADAAEVFG